MGRQRNLLLLLQSQPPSLQLLSLLRRPQLLSQRHPLLSHRLPLQLLLLLLRLQSQQLLRHSLLLQCNNPSLSSLSLCSKRQPLLLCALPPLLPLLVLQAQVSHQPCNTLAYWQLLLLLLPPCQRLSNQ